MSLKFQSLFELVEINSKVCCPIRVKSKCNMQGIKIDC